MSRCKFQDERPIVERDIYLHNEIVSGDRLPRRSYQSKIFSVSAVLVRRRYIRKKDGSRIGARIVRHAMNVRGIIPTSIFPAVISSYCTHLRNYEVKVKSARILQRSTVKVSPPAINDHSLRNNSRKNAYWSKP